MLQLAGLLFAVIGLSLLRAHRWSSVFLLFAVLGGWPLLPYWFGGDAVREGGRPLRIASLNVELGNPDMEGIRRFIRESRADVLLLIEVDQGTLTALEPELRGYVQRIELPRQDPFGIALYARIPMQAERVDNFSSCRLPAISAEIELGGTKVMLAAIHAPPPITASNAVERDQVIGGAVEMLCLRQEPGILLGDLNTTPWAESLERLAFSRGLRETRRGQGLLPSWPAGAPLLRIPIDHCLVRGPWRVLDQHLGGPCGSDHLGLVVDLVLDP